jgi:hypothetical protein
METKVWVIFLAQWPLPMHIAPHMLREPCIHPASLFLSGLDYVCIIHDGEATKVYWAVSNMSSEKALIFSLLSIFGIGVEIMAQIAGPAPFPWPTQ